MTFTDAQRRAMFAKKLSEKASRELRSSGLTDRDMIEAAKRDDVLVISEEEDPSHKYSIHSMQGAALIQKGAKSVGIYSIDRERNILTIRRK